MGLFRVGFHDFFPNLAFFTLLSLYIWHIETIDLPFRDHAVSLWHYGNSENPCHPSNRDRPAKWPYSPRGVFSLFPFVALFPMQ